MASGLTHAFAAIALTEIVSARKRDWRFRSLLVGSALLPDADVIGFALGIHYGDLFGHRGLSHSLLFAAAWSLLLQTRANSGPASGHWTFQHFLRPIKNHHHLREVDEK